MGGFSIEEANTLAGPVENGVRYGGLLKKIEDSLYVAGQLLRQGDPKHTRLFELNGRVAKALMEMEEDQPRNPRTVIDRLGAVADFRLDAAARDYAARAVSLCETVIKRDAARGT
jgi:hypothetical protein